MKKIWLLGLLLCLGKLQAQENVKVETGDINGADFKILIPEQWDNKLVLFAHGYEFMGSQGKQSESPQFPKQIAPYLERGFAVAASDYQYKGFALPQGVDDTEALRRYFVDQYGEPDSIFIVGVSMGGGVALATMENMGEHYDGALPLCPLSSRPYLQVRKEFDIYATFNGLFPGIVPSLQEIFDLDRPLMTPNFSNLYEETQRIGKAITEKDSTLAVAFAHRFDLRLDDLAFSLFFNQNVLRDIAEKTGGNPFDNTNTVYSGFPNDLEVNQKAERLKATADPGILFDKYDRTGNIDKPVLLVHTIYDQLIPPQYGVVNFEQMVHQQGNDEFFTVRYTDGQGHCAFKPKQISEAFDMLRRWVSTGKKAKPGFLE
ncbi:MAG: alpha/beta hydrolase [Saprospiraceae bacterium]|nr:alpha/beta hydrolase [Lewinella sp.]